MHLLLTCFGPPQGEFSAICMLDGGQALFTASSNSSSLGLQGSSSSSSSSAATTIRKWVRVETARDDGGIMVEYRMTGRWWWWWSPLKVTLDGNDLNLFHPSVVVTDINRSSPHHLSAPSSSTAAIDIKRVCTHLVALRRGLVPEAAEGGVVCALAGETFIKVYAPDPMVRTESPIMIETLMQQPL